MKPLSQTTLCLVLLVHLTSGAPSRVIAQTKLLVAADGSGQFRTVQEAVNAVPQTTSSTSPTVIQIKPGIYKELIYVQREKRFVHLVKGRAKFIPTLRVKDT